MYCKDFTVASIEKKPPKQDRMSEQVNEREGAVVIVSKMKDLMFLIEKV